MTTKNWLNAWAQWLGEFHRRLLPGERPGRMSMRACRSMLKADVEQMEAEADHLYTLCHESGKNFEEEMVRLYFLRTLALADTLGVSGKKVAAIIAQAGGKDTNNG